MSFLLRWGSLPLTFKFRLMLAWVKLLRVNWKYVKFASVKEGNGVRITAVPWTLPWTAHFLMKYFLFFSNPCYLLHAECFLALLHCSSDTLVGFYVHPTYPPHLKSQHSPGYYCFILFVCCFWNWSHFAQANLTLQLKIQFEYNCRSLPVCPTMCTTALVRLLFVCNYNPRFYNTALNHLWSMYPLPSKGQNHENLAFALSQ